MSDKTEAPPITVMFDIDGIAVDDINPQIDRRFPHSGSLLRKGFVEGLFIGMHVAPRNASKIINKSAEGGKGGTGSGRPEIRAEAADLMIELQGTGRRVAAYTANPTNDLLALARGISGNGIAAELKRGSNSDKIDALVPGRDILVEDNPWVALRAAKRGIDVVLLETQYSTFAAPVAAGINDHVRTAHDWRGVRERVLSIASQHESAIAAAPTHRHRSASIA